MTPTLESGVRAEVCSCGWSWAYHHTPCGMPAPRATICPDADPILASTSTRTEASVATVHSCTPPVTCGRHAVSWAGMCSWARVSGEVAVLVTDAANPAPPSQACASVIVHGPRHPGFGEGVHLLVASTHIGTHPSEGGVVLS